MRDDETKVVVSVAAMARMVGLSRGRFYQLIQAGVFPAPERQAETNRPFYSEEQQKVVLDVRRRNCGVNGKPVLFYARRLPTSTSAARSRKIKGGATPKADPHAGLLAGVKALGLKAVTAAQVLAAVAELYPHGTAGVDEA